MRYNRVTPAAVATSLLPGGRVYVRGVSADYAPAEGESVAPAMRAYTGIDNYGTRFEHPESGPEPRTMPEPAGEVLVQFENCNNAVLWYGDRPAALADLLLLDWGGGWAIYGSPAERSRMDWLRTEGGILAALRRGIPEYKFCYPGTGTPWEYGRPWETKKLPEAVETAMRF